MREVSPRLLLPTSSSESAKYVKSAPSVPAAAATGAILSAPKLHVTSTSIDIKTPKKETGPQNISSRLFEPTAAIASSRWRSKEELEAAEAARAAEELSHFRVWAGEQKVDSQPTFYNLNLLTPSFRR